MENHLRVLGLLNILLGGFGGVAGGVFFGILGGPTIAAAYGPVIGYIATGAMALMAIMAIPCIVVGIGLFYYRPWARSVGTVVAIIEILNFPIGTVLGLYSLSILMSSAADQFFSPRFNQKTW